jgi:hypothetical protein
MVALFSFATPDNSIRDHLMIRFICICLLTCGLLVTAPVQARDVVAFWGFAEDYDFSATDPTKQDFAADAGLALGANLQAFRGDAADLDDNGGGGFVTFTSSVSGVTYPESRTAKWDDLKGGGDDFDIGGVTVFEVDKNDGAGIVADDFGNDALIYLTFDGSGFEDFQIRFDIEGTPGDLPSTFDIFYRVGGQGTWFRDADQNEIPLTFMDYATPDPDNQFADSGLLNLSALLDGQSQIEIILNDFDENGNGEMEIDNVEISANVVPEPRSLVLLLVAVAMLARRRPA